jgi:hypothetical protein
MDRSFNARSDRRNLSLWNALPVRVWLDHPTAPEIVPHHAAKSTIVRGFCGQAQVSVIKVFETASRANGGRLWLVWLITLRGSPSVLQAAVSRRRFLTSSDVAARAVSPASRSSPPRESLSTSGNKGSGRSPRGGRARRYCPRRASLPVTLSVHTTRRVFTWRVAMWLQP